MDMTAIWVAEHGWVYLNAIIDCCTREIVGWDLDLRCRATEAIARDRTCGRRAGRRARDADARDRQRLGVHRPQRSAPSCPPSGSRHRRGGYRDPESQAFIESWFSKLKERCVWRHEFETLDQAREVIAAYIDRYHHRPHSSLAYRTPREVRAEWDDADQALQNIAA